MNRTKLRIKKLDVRAVIPSYGSEFSAGADLYAVCDEDMIIESGKTAFVHTGISLEIPEGLVGLIYARSGLACKNGLAPANKVGVIDSDYRGEIVVALHNHGDSTRTVSCGDRIAQIVFAPYVYADFEEADELCDTERGAGGFGSTGK
ncbi:MAG: dUTP diphosphatase [Eubacteriales bacterium]